MLYRRYARQLQKSASLYKSRGTGDEGHNKREGLIGTCFQVFNNSTTTTGNIYIMPNLEKLEIRGAETSIKQGYVGRSRLPSSPSRTLSTTHHKHYIHTHTAVYKSTARTPSRLRPTITSNVLQVSVAKSSLRQRKKQTNRQLSYIPLTSPPPPSPLRPSTIP